MLLKRDHGEPCSLWRRNENGARGKRGSSVRLIPMEVLSISDSYTNTNILCIRLHSSSDTHTNTYNINRTERVKKNAKKCKKMQKKKCIFPKSWTTVSYKKKKKLKSTYVCMHTPLFLWMLDRRGPPSSELFFWCLVGRSTQRMSVWWTLCLYGISGLRCLWNAMSV